MSKFINGIKEKNIKKLRSSILDVIHLSVLMDQLEHVVRSCLILGKVYFQFGELDRSFYLFSNLVTILAILLEQLLFEQLRL